MTENISVSRLQVTKFKLNALLEMTQVINEKPSKEKLIGHYEALLRNELKIGKIVLFKYTGSWECLLRSGLTDTDLQIDVERDLLHYDDISFISSNIDSPVRTFDIVIPVIKDNRHLAIALIGDIDEESEGVSPVIKHLHFIQTLSNIVVVAIENIRLNLESLRQVAIKKELELASRLQAMLIPDPKKLPSEGPLTVSAFYHPHMDVGGDYYDFIKLKPDEYGFCICDVSGKGISAAIIMSNFQANLRALFNAEIPLEELVTRLNERVNESTMGERFLTLFIGRYNTTTRELVYVNAGHNAPLVYNKNSRILTTLDSHCVGIGMLDDMPAILSRRLLLEKNVKLLCYTDGLVEILKDDLVEEGTGVIESFLSNEAPIRCNIDDIVRHHCILEGNDSIFDDITLLGFEFS
jgi:phosphoserine phosphatase RsbU/P